MAHFQHGMKEIDSADEWGPVYKQWILYRQKKKPLDFALVDIDIARIRQFYDDGGASCRETRATVIRMFERAIYKGYKDWFYLDTLREWIAASDSKQIVRRRVIGPATTATSQLIIPDKRKPDGKPPRGIKF